MTRSMLAFAPEADDSTALREPLPATRPGKVLIRGRTAGGQPPRRPRPGGLARSYLDDDLRAVRGTDVAGEIGPRLS